MEQHVPLIHRLHIVQTRSKHATPDFMNYKNRENIPNLDFIYPNTYNVDVSLQL